MNARPRLDRARLTGPAGAVTRARNTLTYSSNQHCGRIHQPALRKGPGSGIQGTSPNQFTKIKLTSVFEYTSSHYEYDRAHKSNLRVWPGTRVHATSSTDLTNSMYECGREHEFTQRVRPTSRIQCTSVAGYTSSRNEFDRSHEFNVRVWPGTRVHATSSKDLTNSMYECGREHEFTQRVRPTSRIQCTSVAEYTFQVRLSSRMGFTSEAKYTSSNTEYDRAHEFNLRVWPSTRAQLHTQVAGISPVHFRHDPFLFFLHRLQTLLHFLLTQSRGKRYFRVASPAALPTEICIPTRGTGQHNQLIKR